MSDVFRRLVARTMAQQMAEDLDEACFPHQYALSTRAGTEAVARAMLLATEAVYSLPPGEVARGISRIGAIGPQGPSSDAIKKLSGILEVDAVVTGVLREYGTVRSGSSAANVVSLSVQMIDSGTGRIVWSAAATKGGITIWDRLLGGGGKPMNRVTEKVVNELLDKLFQ